jgi:hypothetical protein
MGLWDRINGSVRGVTDNLLGTNTRASYNPGNAADAADYNGALDQADRSCAVVGTGAAVGGGYAAVGGAVASETGVGIVVAGAGLAVAAEGTYMATNALANLANGNNYGEEQKTHGNSVDSEKPSGNYENTHESGKTYNGVGDEKRMNQSADKVAKENNDPVAKQNWEPAANKKDAYVKEQQGIEGNGGAGNTERNYNQRNSPGKKIIEEQKESQ